MCALCIHVFIIGWEGKLDGARAIADALVGKVDRVTVVYSNAAENDVDGPGEWIRVPNADFFGRKFRRCLDLFLGDIFLLIHADTDFSDWPALVRRCAEGFAAVPELGVWSPDFTYTPWTTATVNIRPVDRLAGLVSVAQTDGIIFAMPASVIARLRHLDYDDNNMGWGIDFAAIAYARITGMLVCRDTTLTVTHQTSRGYSGGEAIEQMQRFYTQLTDAERDQEHLLSTYVILRNREQLGMRGRMISALRRYLRRLPGRRRTWRPPASRA